MISLYPLYMTAQGASSTRFVEIVQAVMETVAADAVIASEQVTAAGTDQGISSEPSSNESTVQVGENKTDAIVE